MAGEFRLFMKNHRYLFLFLFFVLCIPLIIFWSTSGFLNFYMLQASMIYVFLFLSSGFLIFLGMAIGPYNPKVGRYVAYIGLLGFMIFLIVLEMSMLGPYLSSIKNKKPENIFSCNRGDNLCNLLGFKFTLDFKGDTVSFLGFYFFGFAIPFLILWSIFHDFLDASGVIQNSTAKGIVAFGLGALAYRGFVITNLIQILDIGSMGVAVLALNFIFLGGILGYVKRSFKKWKDVENEMFVGKASKYAAELAISRINAWSSKTAMLNAFEDETFKNYLRNFFSETEIATFINKLNNIGPDETDKLDSFRNNLIKEIKKRLL